MATGTDVIDNMPLRAADKADETINLKMVNFALQSSWKQWRMSAQTEINDLVASTYEYSMSGLTNLTPEFGAFSIVVKPTNSYPVDVSRRCRQYYDQAAGYWTLVCSPKLTSKYAGYPMYAMYQYPHPDITDLSDTVYAPLDVLAQSAALFRTFLGASAQNVTADFWKAFAAEYLTAATPLWKRARSEHQTARVGIGGAVI